MRSPFWRMPKEPNDDSFTLSPRAKLAEISAENQFNQFLALIARQSDLAHHCLSKICTR